MSMNDLLGSVLGGGSQEEPGGEDQMADLLQSMLNETAGEGGTSGAASMLGSLLGGGGQSSGGLGGMMGSLLGGGGGSAGILSGLVDPIADTVAGKVGIPKQTAVAVVTFALSKLMEYMSKEDKSIGMDDLVSRMQAGDTDYLEESGFIPELAEQTGLDEATAEQSLVATYQVIGEQIQTE